MNSKDFFGSKMVTKILIGTGALVVLLMVFEAGEAVGFRKATFSYRWGDNYYRNFAGQRRGRTEGFGRRDFLTGSGISGTIIKAETSTLIVHDRDGVEKGIVISPQTAIRRFRDQIQVADLKEGDSVVIIGSPNANGQVEAKLIRVMPRSQASPSAQTPSPSSSTTVPF